jgi:hypothetical protein
VESFEAVLTAKGTCPERVSGSQVDLLARPSLPENAKYTVQCFVCTVRIHSTEFSSRSSIFPGTNKRTRGQEESVQPAPIAISRPRLLNINNTSTDAMLPRTHTRSHVADTCRRNARGSGCTNADLRCHDGISQELAHPPPEYLLSSSSNADGALPDQETLQRVWARSGCTATHPVSSVMVGRGSVHHEQDLSSGNFLDAPVTTVSSASATCSA